MRRFRKWLGNRQILKTALERPSDLSLFRKKPSKRFLLGLGVIVLSYLMAWPLITVFGVISLYAGEPALFVVGSPLVYLMSHALFFVGMWITGKENLAYLNAFKQWALFRVAQKLVVD